MRRVDVRPQGRRGSAPGALAVRSGSHRSQPQRTKYRSDERLLTAGVLDGAEQRVHDGACGDAAGEAASTAREAAMEARTASTGGEAAPAAREADAEAEARLADALLAAASMIRAAVRAGMPAHHHARALSAPEPRLLVSAQPGERRHTHQTLRGPASRPVKLRSVYSGLAVVATLGDLAAAGEDDAAALAAVDLRLGGKLATQQC